MNILSRILSLFVFVVVVKGAVVVTDELVIPGARRVLRAGGDGFKWVRNTAKKEWEHTKETKEEKKARKETKKEEKKSKKTK